MASVLAPAKTSEPSTAQAGATSAAGSATIGGSNAATADTVPGAVDSRSSNTADSAPVASAAPAISGADSVNSDRMITTAVQSQIAADTTGQGANLAVTTLNGVVILTGTVPSADAVEHVKQVAQQVKDVKGVDATAVRVSGS